MNINKKPNFFIVGAQRTGTSSLSYYLSQHPEIFMPQIKEPQFFCDDFRKEADKYNKKNKYFLFNSLNDYLKIFKKANKVKCIGEASTLYLYSKIAAKNIYKFNPHAKIIIILREPIDFLISLHRHLVNTGHENIVDLRKALETEQGRKQGKNLPPRVICPSFVFYSNILRFSNQLKRYFEIFPRQNIKVIFSEDLKNNTKEVYREILKFLGVEDINFQPDFSWQNRGGIVKSKSINKFIIIAKKSRRFVYRYLPYKSILKMYKKFRDLNIDNSINNIDKDLKRDLKVKQKEEVKKMSQILGENLIKKWHY